MADQDAQHLAYRRSLFFGLVVLLAGTAYVLAPNFLGTVPLSVYVALAIMVVAVLGHQISCELILIKFGPTAAIVSTKENRISFKNTRDQLDQCRRMIFRRRISGLLVLLLSIPATTLSTWDYAADNTHGTLFSQICLVLSVWILFVWLCVKMTNRLAVIKFGEPEKQQQQLESEKLRHRIKSRKRGDLSWKQKFVFYGLGIAFGIFLLRLGAHFGIPKDYIKVLIFVVILIASMKFSRSQKIKSSRKSNS